MRKKATGILMFMIILLITGCGKTEMITSQRVDQVLGTVVAVQIHGDDTEDALDEVFAKATEIEQMMSAKDTASELSKLNETGVTNPVAVSSSLYEVIEQALSYASLSEGAFDPTLGRLISLWGIGENRGKVPSSTEIQPLVKNKYQEEVYLDRQEHTVVLSNPTVQLDLGGIAKGYAADEMKKVLVDEYGIKSALLNLGGNVLTIGEKVDGTPWKIGIANPFMPSEVMVVLEVNDGAVVTSGNYQKYFIEEGICYHHILDGKTGYPSDKGLVSTTIITEYAIDADALSTATYNLGLEEGLALVESLEGVEAIFITEEGAIHFSSGIDLNAVEVIQ